MQPTEPGDSPEAVPPKLLAALQRLENRQVFVPPVLDRSILAAARQKLSRHERTQARWLRPRLLWPALASGCAAVSLLFFGIVWHPWSAHQHPGFAREDVNHDGRIDILDAYALARQIESGKRPDTAFDVNGDGVVDRRDAEAIAKRAVRLTPGGRS
jgi:hypothetical protein